MIQKCPNCGQWCETEGAGLLERYGNGAFEVYDKAAKKIGGDDPGVLSTFIGAAVSSYHGIAKGLYKAVLGFRYEFHCPKCGNEWGTDDEADDETNEFLEEIEEGKDEFYSSVQAKIDECINANRPKDAIKYLDKLINESNDDDDIAYLYRRQALIYINNIEDYDAALTACNRGLSALAEEEWSSADTFLYYYKYVAEENLGYIWKARRDALIVYKLAEEEVINLEDGDSIPLEEEALSSFNRLNDEFAEKYLSLDYKDRKAFLTVDSISNAGTTYVDVFAMSTLPSGISFPIGHPVFNKVYIGHPYIPEKYLPIETYQYAFVEDRVREFCEIAQALGAIEITVEALNSSNTNHNGSRDRRASGGASYSGHSASGSYHGNDAYGSVEEKYQTLNFHQEYDPCEPVHLPDKMVWYPHESGWQRLYQQRLKGILSHEERIETRKSQVLSASELKEIKGEVKTIFEANGEWDESIEETFFQEDNAVLSIKVKFAPLSQLTGQSQITGSIQEEKTNGDWDEAKFYADVQKHVNDAWEAAVNIYNDWITEEATPERLELFLNRLETNQEIQYEASWRYFLESLFRYDAIGQPGINNLEQYIKAEVAINDAIIYDDDNNPNPEYHVFKGLLAFEAVFWDDIQFTEKNKKSFFEGKDYLNKYDEYEGLTSETKDFYCSEYEFCELYFTNPEEFWRKYNEEKEEEDTTDAISESEQDYKEMFLDYIADGEISERDRKMLDKFRSRCGISEERAKELEASCSMPQLTEDEQEYLEMYKEYAADGDISERDRKMLNKMRDRMGISEERAMEIEHL